MTKKDSGHVWRKSFDRYSRIHQAEKEARAKQVEAHKRGESCEPSRGSCAIVRTLSEFDKV